MTTSSNRFFRSLAVLLALVAGFNVLIHFTARKSQRQHMLALLKNIPPATDCVFLGNSLVEAGCDVAAFTAAWPSDDAPVPLNLALGATSPVEHCLILNRAFEQPLHTKYLIYGFFDDQLNQDASGDWSDLVGNRALSYYFPDQAAAFYAPGSAFKRWQLRLIGRVPMLAERSSLWAKVELLRRKFEDIGMTKHKTNRFGRVEDFSALEAKDLPSFTNRCHAVVREHRGFSPPVREIISLAQQHGAQVILLEMPMPSHHRNLFYASPAWTQMRAYLQNLARQQHALYLAASDWVPDDHDFEDATHLNEHGAKLFSAKLALAISQEPRTGTIP